MPRPALTLRTRVFVLLLAVAGAASLALDALATQAPPAGWYKGNTHTHTLNSDGDSPPNDVVEWYRSHRYHFLVLTDHNFLTSVDGLNALHGADGKFLVIRGEEVTDGFEGKPLHINGLDVATRVVPRRARASSTSCSATWTRSARRTASRTSTIRTSAGR